MHRSCQNDIVQPCQEELRYFELLQSVIWKLSITSRWKTYSKASLRRNKVNFAQVSQFTGTFFSKEWEHFS